MIDSAKVPAPPAVGLRGYDASFVSDATSVDTGPETLVQQSFAEEADINVIVRRFGISGSLPLGPSGPAVYGDFTGITDYVSARETIERAKRSFMELPAEVRARFKNDPAELIAFAQGMTEEEFVSALESDSTTEPVVAPDVDETG